MTQSDKDFITRVQVAQLVTSDPYADDFYAQVYTSIKQQRNASEINLLKLGSAGASQGHSNQRGPHRRENAIQRMQAQVERLVNNMKSRELSKETGGKIKTKGEIRLTRLSPAWPSSKRSWQDLWQKLQGCSTTATASCYSLS